MADKRERMGFSTPAGNLEDALGRVQAELAKTKANWGNIKAMIESGLTEVTQNVTKMKELGKRPGADVLLLGWGLMLGNLISKIGMEQTETHERLARCEKAIQELKLKSE